MIRFFILFILMITAPLSANYTRTSLNLEKQPLTEALCEKILAAFIDDHPDAKVYMSSHCEDIQRAAQDSPGTLFSLLEHVSEVALSDANFTIDDVNPYLGELNFPWALYFKGVFIADLYEGDKKKFENLFIAFEYFKDAYTAGHNGFALAELFKFYALGWMSLDAYGDFKLLDHLEAFKDFAKTHHEAAHTLSMLYASETRLHDIEKAHEWQKFAQQMNVENARYEDTLK